MLYKYNIIYTCGSAIVGEANSGRSQTPRKRCFRSSAIPNSRWVLRSLSAGVVNIAGASARLLVASSTLRRFVCSRCSCRSRRARVLHRTAFGSRLLTCTCLGPKAGFQRYQSPTSEIDVAQVRIAPLALVERCQTYAARFSARPRS